MDSLILHHYSLSPYAAKTRMVLNYKKLPWRSVEVPMIMPKPLLGALTGGWRMVPVLQEGADIYLDSKLIVERLEQLGPSPSIFASTDPVREAALSQWGQSVFMDGVRLSLCEGRLPAPFLDDRRQIVPDGLLDINAAQAAIPSLTERVRSLIVLAERQLQDGRHYLCGETASLVDFSAWVSLGPALKRKSAAIMFAGCEKVLQWLERVAAYDHCTGVPMTGEEAIEVAAKSNPDLSTGTIGNDPNGYGVGEHIRFSSSEYRCEPVAGEVLRTTASTISVVRHDSVVGDVVVHFPRDMMDVERVLAN
ncbi:glutathione S-transferase family protein [Paraburkholderia tropica]|uniref:glutathione S-transferase family protein n=1 Tax=Paraburkholderia tropica TaxID=92647 RepID=UPI002AB68565|nr:glutathione S-transferase family protein [Paraburkholderia tropica]